MLIVERKYKKRAIICNRKAKKKRKKGRKYYNSKNIFTLIKDARLPI